MIRRVIEIKSLASSIVYEEMRDSPTDGLANFLFKLV
jgi:hypothetical protein